MSDFGTRCLEARGWWLQSEFLSTTTPINSQMAHLQRFNASEGKGQNNPAGMRQNGSSQAAIFSLVFFFHSKHTVGIWPSLLTYTSLLKQFCSFWGYFNLPDCDSYLVRKLCEEENGLVLSCWVLFRTTLGQWAAVLISCCAPFQLTAGFPRRPLLGFTREILIGEAEATLAWAGAVTGVSYFTYSLFYMV